MDRTRIGVRLESLDMPIRAAIDAAASLGVGSIAFDATGELQPDRLSQTGRRQLSHILRTRELAAAGIGVASAQGFDVDDRLDARVARTMAVLRFAYEMGAPFAFNHLGQIPDPTDAVRRAVFTDVLQRIGHEANRVGAIFAIHTTFESPAQLAELLAELNNPGIAVLYDPANVMVRAGNPYEGLEKLVASTVGIVCKDVMRTGMSATGFEETPIGAGEMDWPRLHATAAAAHFLGRFIVARETGQRRLADLQSGIAHLMAGKRSW